MSAKIWLSQPPQPETAPVFLEISARSVKLLLANDLILAAVVPLQWQMMSWSVSVCSLYIGLSLV